MIINYDPTITGGFVYHVMKHDAVRKLLDELDISDKEKHNLVKAVLIVGTKDLELDINKKILRAKFTE